MPKVYNKHHKNAPPDAVYIGRPTKWGNPFSIGKDGTREQVIEKFKHYVLARPELIQAAQRELVGRDLVCFCAPKPCHGDVWLIVANFKKVTGLTKNS